MGLHLQWNGVTKCGNGGVDGEGVKVRIFLVRPPILGNSPPSTAPTFLKYTLLYIAEKPVNRGIAAFFWVEEGGEHPEGGCKRGTGEGARGVWEGTEWRRLGCCTATAYRTQHSPASSWLNQADEATN